MSDYPLVRILLCVLVVLLTPKSIDKVVNMRLKKVLISADRTSPALAAIQDALTLKDLEFELKQKEKNTSELIKPEKVKLKGMKISLDESMKNIKSELKIQALALRGEQIDVRHFSNKFINTKNSFTRAPRILIATNNKASKERLLSAAENLNNKVKEKTLSSGVVVRVDEPVKILSTEEREIVSPNTPSTNIYLASKNLSPSKLSGSIMLSGGSFTRSGRFTYYIERKFEGKTFEALSLRGDKNEYEMDLIDQKGFVTAELRGPSGEILAYGEADIKKGHSTLDLTLEPSAGLFAGQTVESEELSDNTPSETEILVADSKTFVAGVEGTLSSDAEGYFGKANLFSKSSEFLSSTFKKNYWPTLSLTEAGKSHYPRLIKRSVVDRLEADLDPFGEAVKIESLLLGKVTHKGLSKEGLKVEIFGQTYQRPIYFSKNGKPETSLEHTSVHGGFVFTNLPDGGYLVQVTDKNIVLSQKWFVVRTGHISRGQIDLRQKTEKFVLLESFPTASSDKDLSLRELGLDEEININSLIAELRGAPLSSKTDTTVSVLEIFEGSSRQLSLIASKSTSHNLKRVDFNWLESFLNRQRSNRNNKLGLVVGFIQDENFEILKDATDFLTPSSEIYYFDKNGAPSSQGLEDGGFVVTNTRLGFQPLVVKLEESNRFLNKVVYTSAKSVSVF